MVNPYQYALSNVIPAALQKSGKTTGGGSATPASVSAPKAETAKAPLSQNSKLPTVTPQQTIPAVAYQTGGAVPGARTFGMTEEQFMRQSQRRRPVTPIYPPATTAGTAATTTGTTSGTTATTGTAGTTARTTAGPTPGTATTTTAPTSVGTSGQPYTAPQRGAVNAEQYGSYTRFGEGMYEGMRAKEQKAAAHKPGAGLWALGIDPKDPNAASKAEAYVAKYKDKLGWLTNGTWGRSKVPGYGKLKQMYPQASADKLLDVAYRQAMSESSLPPRDFLQEMIDPLVMAVLSSIPGAGQVLAPMYGAIKGGVEGGPLAALMGGLQGATAFTPIGGYNVPTGLISAAGGAINPDLGTALTLASGGAKGLLEGNWRNLAGSAAGKLAAEVTGNPLYALLASQAAGKAVPGGQAGPVAPIVDKSVKV